ncbi:Uncharacterized protein Fot_23829 [Forsythia ovata]|uniref:Uncharacterized protein n=1 Tax=Forsythia ovata TaxID=205694 RepID=A0ABD1U4H2_9LAMI
MQISTTSGSSDVLGIRFPAMVLQNNLREMCRQCLAWGEEFYVDNEKLSDESDGKNLIGVNGVAHIDATANGIQSGTFDFQGYLTAYFRSASDRQNMYIAQTLGCMVHF